MFVFASPCKSAVPDQEGKGRLKVLTADATRRLRHWIATAGITEVALWRSVPNHKPDRFAQRLGDGDVARIYMRRAAAVIDTD